MSESLKLMSNKSRQPSGLEVCERSTLKSGVDTTESTRQQIAEFLGAEY